MLGFLAFYKVDTESGNKLQVGQLLETVITNTDSPAILHVTAHHSSIAPAVLTEHAGTDIGALLLDSTTCLQMNNPVWALLPLPVGLNMHACNPPDDSAACCR